MIFDAKHEMIRKLVRQFAETELTTEVLDKVEATGEFPEEIVDKMAKCGFLGLKIPREYGGAGADTLAYVIMIEEIARVSAVASLYANTPNSLGGGPLMLAGSKEQKEKYLTKACTGAVGAFALTEPNAGSDAAAAKTKAISQGDEYIINGSKCFISNMGQDEGDYVILIVLTDPEKKTKGMSAIIVDRDTPGFTVPKTEDKMGLRAAPVSELYFDECHVPKSQLLGEEGKGFAIAMAGLDGGRIGMASQAVGLAESCIAESVEYSTQRVQFGKPVNANQGLQWYLADMATKTEAAKALTLNAEALRQAGKNITKEAAMAKYYASETAVEVANKALQIHGGYGYMKEYAIERQYRDARIIPIYEGTSEVQKMVISRAVINGK